MAVDAPAAAEEEEVVVVAVAVAVVDAADTKRHIQNI